MGDAAEPDYNGRIQLRHGKFKNISRQIKKHFPQILKQLNKRECS